MTRTQREVGSGHYREYGQSDVRFVVIWYRWGQLTGNHHSVDAITAGGMARHFHNGWVIKARGSMFRTLNPTNYLDTGLVAVNLDFE